MHRPLSNPIPIHIQPTPIDDSVPNEEEIIAAVKRLKNNHATGPSRMRSEDVKQWLHLVAYPPDARPPPIPQPDKWNKLVELIQHIFSTG